MMSILETRKQQKPNQQDKHVIMSEVKSLRFNDSDLETWVDEHVQKGELNSLMNHLLQRYRQEQEQEYIEVLQDAKIDREITIFQGVIFISIAAFLLIFSLSKIYDVLSIIATYLGVLGGVLICIYVIISTLRHKEGNVSSGGG